MGSPRGIHVHVRSATVRVLVYKMAVSSSDPSVELDGQPQQVLVDVRWAKKAIAKVGGELRKILESDERKEVLVKRRLLEQKDVKDVVKGLQQKIEESPNLFGVLLRELSNFPDGADVVKKLQGTYSIFNYYLIARLVSPASVDVCDSLDVHVYVCVGTCYCNHGHYYRRAPLEHTLSPS